MNFRTHAIRSAKLRAHLKYLISKPILPNVFPNKTSQPNSKWGNSQNNRLPCQTHKKNLSLRCSAPLARYTRDNFPVDTDNKKSEAFNRASELVGIDIIHKKKKRPYFTSAKNIDSQISKPVPKVLTIDMHNPSDNPIDERNLQDLESRF